MVHAQILLFYSTIIGGLWQKNSHSKLGGAFPKREVSKSATATILTSRTNPGHVSYYATFKLKFMYSQLPHNA